jgi:hypothetical protein
MPALALETSLRSKREFGHLLGVHGPHAPRGKQIADGYVRLVEKAVLEYQASRGKLLRFLSDGFADDYHRAQDHFESSIQSLHRAVLYLDRLRSMGFRNPNGTPFVPRPRELEPLRDEVKARIRDLRDRAEHLDGDILSQTIAPDAGVAIHLGWEKASLADAQVTYQDFARWITRLHHFALLLSQVRITVGGPAAPC